MAKFRKFFKSKRNKKKKNKKSKSDPSFIIEFNNAKKNEAINDIQLLDQRRLVFISLIGLYQTWQQCTSTQLYTALFMLPLKRKWIYNPSKYKKQLKVTFQNIMENKDFIRLLKYKDSQGLVFWILDSHKQIKKQKVQQSEKHSNIAPFWRYVSDKLVTLYDPITQNTYKPIQFREQWWTQLTTEKLKFSDDKTLVMSELSCLSSNYKQIQEILHQSNADSLNPIIAYTPYTPTMDTLDSNSFPSLQCSDDETEQANWCIVDGYDPYDIQSEEILESNPNL